MSTPKRPRGRPRKYTDDGQLIEYPAKTGPSKYQIYKDYYKAYQANYRKQNKHKIDQITRSHSKRKQLCIEKQGDTDEQKQG